MVTKGEKAKAKTAAKSTAKPAATTTSTATTAAASEAKKTEQKAEDAQRAASEGRVFPESEANVAGVAGQGDTGEDPLFRKMRESGLVLNEDHVGSENWIGPSVQTEGPEFAYRKIKVRITPIDSVVPRTGMLVRPDGLKGDSFTVGDNFGPGGTPRDWAAVINPANGKGLFD